MAELKRASIQAWVAIALSFLAIAGSAANWMRQQDLERIGLMLDSQQRQIQEMRYDIAERDKRLQSEIKELRVIMLRNGKYRGGNQAGH
jgi:hypothetical protein